MQALNKWILLGVLCCSPISAPVFADGDGSADLDVTMSVVDADDTAEDAVNVLELPEIASDTAKEAAALGLETAGKARAAGQERGDDLDGDVEAAGRLKAGEMKAIIADARARGDAAASNAEAAAAAARENADAAREAAEEALKNALGGANYRGSIEDVREILDNLPDDVKEHLPDNIEDILDNVTDRRPETPGSS